MHREQDPKHQPDEDSLMGTLFSTIVFVGGGIGFFTVLLFVFYHMRL